MSSAIRIVQLAIIPIELVRILSLVLETMPEEGLEPTGWKVQLCPDKLHSGRHRSYMWASVEMGAGPVLNSRKEADIQGIISSQSH